MSYMCETMLYNTQRSKIIRSINLLNYIFNDSSNKYKQYYNEFIDETEETLKNILSQQISEFIIIYIDNYDQNDIIDCSNNNLSIDKIIMYLRYFIKSKIGSVIETNNFIINVVDMTTSVDGLLSLIIYLIKFKYTDFTTIKLCNKLIYMCKYIQKYNTPYYFDNNDISTKIINVLTELTKICETRDETIDISLQKYFNVHIINNGDNNNDDSDKNDEQNEIINTIIKLYEITASLISNNCFLLN